MDSRAIEADTDMLPVEFVSDSTHNISRTLPIKANQAETNQDDDETSTDSEVSGVDEALMPLISTQDFASENLPKHPSITPHADNPLCRPRPSLNSPVDEVLPWSLQDAGKRSRNPPITSAGTFFNIRSPVLSTESSWPFITQHQARLLKHYVRELTPWVSALMLEVARGWSKLTSVQVDSCDNLAHFATEVPRRVPFYPILASAMYALSSRHLSLLHGTEDEESPRHAEKCIQMLITSLNDPFAHWDENLLAAVVIMRLHEELGQGQDFCYHLLGTRKILDSISAFAADGGLREAASWVSLRQHIYISLTEQQPLGIALQNFNHSSIVYVTSTSNEDWAKRMILIFARILDHAFAVPEQNQDGTVPSGWWNDLKVEVETWYKMKPWDFAPLWTDMVVDGESALPTPGSVPGMTTTPHDTPPGHTTAQSTSPHVNVSRVWPELLVAHQSQIVGLQYYHLARIALALYDPNLARIGFLSIRARQASEKIVVDGIKHIVGLSVSNEGAKNAMFEASHILKVCGDHLRKEAEQTAAVTFLELVQRKLGWQTVNTIEELRRAWAND